MQRISVVGCSGSGKTTFSRRLGVALDVPVIELDAVHHLPNWIPIRPDEFRREVRTLTQDRSWIVDGNYSVVTTEGPVWERADTVIVLDLPKVVVMWQVIARTLRRAVTREVLWNGNREPFFSFLRWTPEDNVIRWAWTRHGVVRRRYLAAAASDRFAHLQFVFLHSRAEQQMFLASAAPSRATE